jgi:trehalose 6-phosphate synthase
LASELRQRGVNNRIGFFLHIPFPTPEVFNALPPHAELLEQLCDYDLLGFQTESDRLAFLDCVSMQTRLTTRGGKKHVAWGNLSTPKSIRSVSIRKRLRAAQKGRCRRSWRS